MLCPPRKFAEASEKLHDVRILHRRLTFSSKTYRIVFLDYAHSLTISTSGWFEQNLGSNTVKKVAGVYNKSTV